SKPVKAGPYCALCELVMTQLDQMLQQNSTVQEIESALEQVCNFLPATMRQECDDFVKQYTPTLVQLLLQVSPDKACSYLGLCTSNKVSKPVKAGPYCALCELVMTQLDKMLQQNSTVPEIEAALVQVCNFLPATVRQECDDFVLQYTPTLVQLLLQVSPDKACSYLGLCTSNKVSKPVKAGPYCALCELVMTQLDKMLQQNSTVQEIESALEQVCNFLPATVRQECDDFVKQYTPTLVQLLLQVSPDKACSYLGLCTSNKVSKPVKAGPYCALCELVMTQLDKMLQQNSTVQEIESALEQVCNFLPAT
ncbi:prosaposin, partial [Aplysia californica]|uniref:Prosaposin n=1 Tax=Aplysia californica TaxID=6500 RepID=A0ABM0KBH0_APLCA